MAVESAVKFCFEWNGVFLAGFVLIALVNAISLTAAVFLKLHGQRRPSRRLAGSRNALRDLGAIREAGVGVSSSVAGVLLVAQRLAWPAALVGLALFGWGGLDAVYTCEPP